MSENKDIDEEDSITRLKETSEVMQTPQHVSERIRMATDPEYKEELIQTAVDHHINNEDDKFSQEEKDRLERRVRLEITGLAAEAGEDLLEMFVGAAFDNKFISTDLKYATLPQYIADRLEAVIGSLKELSKEFSDAKEIPPRRKVEAYEKGLAIYKRGTRGTADNYLEIAASYRIFLRLGVEKKTALLMTGYLFVCSTKTVLNVVSIEQLLDFSTRHLCHMTGSKRTACHEVISKDSVINYDGEVIDIPPYLTMRLKRLIVKERGEK